MSATTMMRLEGEPHHISKVRDAVDEALEVFDFNSLLPCPVELEVTHAPTKIVPTQGQADQINDLENSASEADGMGFKVYAITEAEAEARRRIFNAVNWYEWKMENWGVRDVGRKANILSTDNTSMVVAFSTLFTFPKGLFTFLTTELGLTLTGGSLVGAGQDFVRHGDAALFNKYFELSEEHYCDEAHVVVERNIYER